MLSVDHWPELQVKAQS